MTLTKNIDKMGSPDRFGSNWKKFRNFDTIYEDQFLEWILPFQKNDLKNKKILDAGCGIGRNTFYCIKYGAKQVHSFDIEESTVNIATENLKNFKNAYIFKDSIFTQEKISDESFDLVMSIGVIHHLSDPKLAVTKLFNKVKKDGMLLVWVYGYEGNEILIKLLNTLRLFTTRLPYKFVAAIGKFFALLLYWILKFYPTKSKYWTRAKKMSLYVLEQIIIDQLIPKIANYYKEDELIEIYKHISYKNIQINHCNKNSWSLLITK